MSTDICRNCRKEIDTDYGCEDCDIAPDNYVRPGTHTLMYVNAYQVTRHFGGPEEGGWWFNHHEPLASIPIEATSFSKHDSSCWNCDRDGKADRDGTIIKACKWGFHLVPNTEQADKFREHLEKIFAEVKEGNIYSVLGGADMFVAIQDHPGEATPRPHYE